MTSERVRRQQWRQRSMSASTPAAAAVTTAPPSGCTRRRVLAWLGAVGAVPLLMLPPAQPRAQEPPAAAGLLRAGGVALLLRHASTTPGVGDPPGFRAGDCTTQRNLSDAGREQARRIGAWFERHGLAPAAVRSSAWCRCLDTARLAFGDGMVQPWPVLDSLFRESDGPTGRARLAALDGALRALAAGRFEVWVTHQVNITAATGAWVEMGEGVLVRAAGRVDSLGAGGGTGTGTGTGTGAGAPPASPASPPRPLVLAKLAFDA